MTELKGFAVLPADTFAEGPPAGDGISANGRTGPFSGQPVQGFSGVQFAPSGDGSYWFLSDNGFGAQGNSTDYLLRIYQLDPDFAGLENGDRSVEIEDFVQLSDPRNLIPFEIINEDTQERLLTGGDFDIESFVIANNGDIWVGEEFGPYLLHFNSNGVLLEAPIATPNFPTIPLNTLNGQEPLVIAHRGASGDFPEHTLEAYRAAIAAGADFIEPDLAITSDGVLIARHEPMLAILNDEGEVVSATTNVAEVFPDRVATKTLDGEVITGWFAEDFTLEEIKQLRAVQSRAGRDTGFDGFFEVPTLQEVIELVQQVEAETGVQVGIYPETKHPTFFDEQGLSLEEPLIQTLQDTGFTDPDRIFIQSFEFANLIDLQNNLLPAAGLENLPLVQLYGDVEDAFINENGGGFSVPFDIVANFSNPEFTAEDARATYGDLVDLVPDFGADLDGDNIPDTTYADLANAEVFNAIGAAYAEGVGPWKNSFILREPLAEPVDGNGDGVAQITSQLTGEVRPYIEWAHDAGMQIHPYTLRDEEPNLALNPDGTVQTPEQEFEQLIDLGADGFFTDFARTGDPVRDAIAAEEVRSPQNPDFRFNSLDGNPPIVIAHRGASGDFPEHTLEAYRLAIAQGADFVEPDLAITSDGVLIARHEPTLAQVELDENGEILLDGDGNPIVLQNSTLTTNVPDLPQYADRVTVKSLDGTLVGGWFAEDFTLEEIKADIRAVQSRDFRSDAFDNLFEIPTFQEVIELVQEMEQFGFEGVGIYPETKHPTFFDQQGLSLEEPLIQTLQETGFTDPDRIFIQSFEFANLIEMQGLLDAADLGDLPLVQLYGNTTEGAPVDDNFSFPFDIRFNVEQGNDLAAIYGQDFLDAAENPLSLETVYGDLDNPEILQVISANYAEGAGPWKNNFVLREPLAEPVDGNGDGVAEITSQLTGEIGPFVEDAHAAGLQVHPYTLRDEERFLTLKPDGTPQTTGEEFVQLTEIGVDGFFTDFPETGRIALEPLVEPANISGSRGFEGMAFSPDGQTFYPLLEGAVEGDPANSRRIYEFDAETGEYTGFVGFYGTAANNHAIGDFTPINDTEFLVIERDGSQGDLDGFKQIFKIDLSEVDENGFVAKELVVDLLNIPDPNDLNNDGETTYTMPFVTIEDVLVLDETTILVANDNNYPFSVGRPETGEIDNNEIVAIELDEPLDLDPRLGAQAQSLQPTFGSLAEDDLDAADPDTGLDGFRDLIFSGGGSDGIDTSQGLGSNRIFSGSGADEMFAGLGDRLNAGAGDDILDATGGRGGNRLFGDAGNDDFFLGGSDRVLGGAGADRMFVGADGENILTGGTDADQFWIANAEFPAAANTVTDFAIGEDVIGISGLGASFETLQLANDADGNATIGFNNVPLAVLLGIDFNLLSAADFAIL